MRFSMLLVLLVVINFTGCSRYGPDIVFIFPNGFNGLALISEDKTNGVNWKRVNGQYSVEIPPSGSLAVKSLKPFYCWHKEIGRYSGRGKLADETSTNGMDKAFYNLSIVGGEGIYLLVGTKAEYDQIQGQTFSRLPLATKISSINFKALNP